MDVTAKKNFYLHYCTKRYSFQIEKCGDPTCCPPSWLPGEMFSKIKGLPDPTFTTELYGTDTDDTDCSSTALRQERERELSSLFIAVKVRGVALCLAL